MSVKYSKDLDWSDAPASEDDVLKNEPRLGWGDMRCMHEVRLVDFMCLDCRERFQAEPLTTMIKTKGFVDYENAVECPNCYGVNLEREGLMEVENLIEQLRDNRHDFLKSRMETAVWRECMFPEHRDEKGINTAPGYDGGEDRTALEDLLWRARPSRRIGYNWVCYKGTGVNLELRPSEHPKFCFGNAGGALMSLRNAVLSGDWTHVEVVTSRNKQERLEVIVSAEGLPTEEYENFIEFLQYRKGQQRLLQLLRLRCPWKTFISLVELKGWDLKGLLISRKLMRAAYFERFWVPKVIHNDHELVREFGKPFVGKGRGRLNPEHIGFKWVAFPEGKDFTSTERWVIQSSYLRDIRGL